MSDMKLHTLGCGSAKPSVRHQPSSHVLDYRGNLFMIDCGEGAQQAFQRHRLKFSRLGHIFLTHLHGDHVFGLPGLVGTLGLSGIGGEIVIHTFEEGKRILSDILGFFCRDLDINVRFNVIASDRETVVFESKALKVTAIPLRHRVPTVGYLFEEVGKLRHLKRDMLDFHQVPVAQYAAIKEGADFVKPDGTVVPNALLTRDADEPLRYAHVSDTAYLPELAGRIGPVNLLFHETTYLDDNEKAAAERGHSTARQAAMLARDSGAKALLTGHYSSRYHDLEAFAKEAREVFDNVIVNDEGLVTDIGLIGQKNCSFNLFRK